jgi:hypothetical protein
MTVYMLNVLRYCFAVSMSRLSLNSYGMLQCLFSMHSKTILCHLVTTSETKECNKLLQAKTIVIYIVIVYSCW